MSNLGNLQRAMAGTSANQLGGLATIRQAFDIAVPFTKAAADGMASTATANTMFWMNPYDETLYITAASLAPTATLTAHDTDFATITIKTDDAAGGTPAVAVTWTTQISAPGTGNWAVGVKETGVLTKANVAIPAGGCLWFNIAKAGSGVVVGISHYVLRVQKGE